VLERKVQILENGLPRRLTTPFRVSLTHCRDGCSAVIVKSEQWDAVSNDFAGQSTDRNLKVFRGEHDCLQHPPCAFISGQCAGCQ
jgi:hypothetical protein